MTLECPRCKRQLTVDARPPGTPLRCRCGETLTVPALAQSAGKLQCPQCGGAAAPEDTSCSYCHAVLALAACPRCFGRVFRGHAFCPGCGAKIGAPALGTVEGASQLLCPSCHPSQVALTAHLVGEALLDECPRCGGTWLALQVFDRVLQNREQQASLLGLATGGAASAVPLASPPALPIHYLPCPTCRALMNRRNFGQRSGVVLSMCKGHGVWFERDQLSAVLRFVLAGGLDQARRQEHAEAVRPHPPRPTPLLTDFHDGDGARWQVVTDVVAHVAGLIADLWH